MVHFKGCPLDLENRIVDFDSFVKAPAIPFSELEDIDLSIDDITKAIDIIDQGVFFQCSILAWTESPSSAAL